MRAKRLRWGALFLLGFGPVAMGAETTDAVSPDAVAEEVPDMAFLEYLGALVREEDGWLDPTDLRGRDEEERDRVAEHSAAPLPFRNDEMEN